MKVFSSILLCSAMLSQLVMAEDAASGVRQVSQPTAKAIKRRATNAAPVAPPSPADSQPAKEQPRAYSAAYETKYAPYEAKPPQYEAKAAAKAPESNFNLDEIIRSLTAEFNDDWAQRRGIKVPPKQPQAQQQNQQQRKLPFEELLGKVNGSGMPNMDSLMNSIGLKKEDVLPIVEEFKNAPADSPMGKLRQTSEGLLKNPGVAENLRGGNFGDLAENVRKQSAGLFQDPNLLNSLMDNPIFRQLSDTILPPGSQQAKTKPFGNAGQNGYAQNAGQMGYGYAPNAGQKGYAPNGGQMGYSQNAAQKGYAQNVGPKGYAGSPKDHDNLQRQQKAWADFFGAPAAPQAQKPQSSTGSSGNSYKYAGQNDNKPREDLYHRYYDDLSDSASDWTL